MASKKFKRRVSIGLTIFLTIATALTLTPFLFVAPDTSTPSVETLPAPAETGLATTTTSTPASVPPAAEEGER